MKKLITLCFFAFALLFSTQGFDAQNIKDINAYASDQAKEIRKIIKIDNNQLEEVYQAYKEFQTNYVKFSKDMDGNQKQIEKLNAILDTRLKSILNEEQFEKYLSIFRAE